MLNFLRKLFGKRVRSIAILVDGPNMIRKEFKVDLKEVKEKIKRFGNIRFAKVYLDQYASDKLIEAVTNQGFEPVIVPSDVDVILAVEAMELVLEKDIDTLVLVTRDTDFIPVVRKAKERGKKVFIVATRPGLSSALKNTADRIFYVGGRKGEPSLRKTH